MPVPSSEPENYGTGLLWDLTTAYSCFCCLLRALWAFQSLNFLPILEWGYFFAMTLSVIQTATGISIMRPITTPMAVDVLLLPFGAV